MGMHRCERYAIASPYFILNRGNGGKHVRKCRHAGGIVRPSRVKSLSKFWKLRSQAAPDRHYFVRCHTLWARFGSLNIFSMKKLATVVAV